MEVHHFMLREIYWVKTGKHQYKAVILQYEEDPKFLALINTALAINYGKGYGFIQH